MRGVTLIATSVLASLVGAGCGIPDPYNHAKHRPPARPATSVPAPAAPAGPAASTPEAATMPGTETPQAVLTWMALLYGNWDQRTVKLSFAKILALSVGRAREQLRQTAAQTVSNVAQSQGGVRSRATVAGLVVRGTGRRQRAIVVTRELVTGGGVSDDAARYRVTLAVAQREPGGWRIEQWSPQP
jgi:hypothetical protein